MLTLTRSGDITLYAADVGNARSYATVQAFYTKGNGAWSATVTMDDGSKTTANVMLDADIFSSTPGVDLMIGGGGNDIYYVDRSDIVIEKPGEGVDTVVSSVNTILGPDLENLLLTQDAIYATGNERGNSLVGNSQYNVLSGKAGRDFLYGGRGADILVGGSDRDVFVFRTNDTGSTSSTADVIKDFRPEEGDRIDLSGFDGNSTRAGMQHLRYVEGTFTGRGQVKAITVKDETRLLINIDQDSAAEAVIVLPGHRHVAENWFVL